MKRLGFANILVLVSFLFLIIFVASNNRRQIYSTYQHLGAKLGLNFNNIATQNYVNWIESQSDRLESNYKGIFLGKEVEFVDRVAINPKVLGTNTPDDNKWIEVDLSEQRLYMKESGNSVGSFLVSTGKWAPTPKGEWRIWTKLRYTRMQGGSKALGTYYNLPNVPYTMYYNQGYGVHGAYWHNNFGNTMSHGCVNMKPEEAGIVFNWATVGTRVVVHE